MEQLQGLGRPIRTIAGDRRLTMHLMGLWQGLRQGAYSGVHAEDYFAGMPEDFWVDCCVMRSALDGDARIERIGENLGRQSGVNDVTTTFSRLPPRSLMAVAMRDHDLAFTRGAPILDEGEARDVKGRRVLFRSIMVPLYGDEGGITQILAGARCRVRVEDA